MQIYNLNGQLIKSKALIVPDEVEIFQLEISDLISGVYQILVIDEKGFTHNQ